MPFQDLGHQSDPQSFLSYITSATGLAVSGLTLLQVISLGVGIALGVVSIIGIILTYMSASKRDRAERDKHRAQELLAQAQLEALQRANEISDETA